MHLRYSFTTTPRFLRNLSHLSPSPISAYRPYLFLISPVSPFGFLLFPPTPIFPRFPQAQPRYRTVASVPSYLISDRRRGTPTLTAQLAYRGNPSLRFSHACSTFPTDRENSLTLAPSFVTLHRGHAPLFSVHGHASKQYIRRAPCTVVSSDSI